MSTRLPEVISLILSPFLYNRTIYLAWQNLPSLENSILSSRHLSWPLNRQYHSLNLDILFSNPSLTCRKHCTKKQLNASWETFAPESWIVSGIPDRVDREDYQHKIFGFVFSLQLNQTYLYDNSTVTTLWCDVTTY